MSPPWPSSRCRGPGVGEWIWRCRGALHIAWALRSPICSQPLLKSYRSALPVPCARVSSAPTCTTLSFSATSTSSSPSQSFPRSCLQRSTTTLYSGLPTAAARMSSPPSFVPNHERETGTHRLMRGTANLRYYCYKSGERNQPRHRCPSSLVRSSQDLILRSTQRASITILLPFDLTCLAGRRASPPAREKKHPGPQVA
ncbi:hypothetical protein DFH06DRAFT_106498 [Mycena polygramma]|nr:hypothetical protein DFH06DRAFT_106498 [Mycena polygramma]